MLHKVFTERPDNEQCIVGLPGKDVAEREGERDKSVINCCSIIIAFTHFKCIDYLKNRIILFGACH